MRDRPTITFGSLGAESVRRFGEDKALEGDRELHGILQKIGLVQVLESSHITDDRLLPKMGKVDGRQSGRRDSDSRPSPWQGDALPLSHARIPTTVVESTNLP